MEPASIRIETLRGEAIRPFLPDLARLRTTVFRAWPYLYEGSEAYERDYLRCYADCGEAAAILAFDGDRVVGAATCLPLVAETDAIQAPIRDRGWKPERFMYFGESVLLPPYRGRGIGVAFFEAREAHARVIPGCDFACFCSVRREPDHPQRPAGFVPLDDFWRRRGYSAVPGLACTMSWLDVGDMTETEKTLDFWVRSLSGAVLP